MAPRRRLDKELVRRELAQSRQEAQRLIDANSVLVNGAVANKAARQVQPGDALRVVEQPKYVGRGALKLVGALETFQIDPAGLRCLDVGASTGGFTDVLLQAGAAHVTALDVGHGQLHERIRADERVVTIERTNMRHVQLGDLGDLFDLVVADVSFISLRTLMPNISSQLASGGGFIALIKPQFEAGKQEVSKGQGVVTDPRVWRRTVDGVVASAIECSLRCDAMAVSPITGGDGNVEFLGLFSKSA